ncbi:MAG: hypothetical protein UY35_C0002G0035 [Candidatus Saccharibacteria bacterium GW2011_GWC2_48_9]|nr:MAG: hypothetical protein UY35_C0002G0035 [Candidatus Saccharibacteria bacterium GW2011_GWC2_48_9]HCH34924.1 hypothetical protein [Candidatus Saccharibacteria bacterium]
MHKTDFKSFKVGTIFNSAVDSGEVGRPYSHVEISYPSRLEAMALDPAKIADNNNLIYEAGQVDFCVALYKKIKVTLDLESKEITISERTPRKGLIRHAALLMRQALNLDFGLIIDVDDPVNLRHCGLGSSSSLIAGTAAAINELFGAPMAPQDLVRYCAQNHGEEVDSDDSILVPVQCIGGSGVCGHFDGGLVVLAGQATPITTYILPETTRVVIGIPSDFNHPDSTELMNAEVDNINGFREAGEAYGPDIAYRLVHEALPGLVNNNLKPMKDLIFDYRWNMGSIENCSFVYPKMIEIAEALRDLRDDDRIEILSLSSVGPAFFGITNDVEYLEDRFKSLGMNTYVTKIHNGAYILNERN